MEFGGKIYKKAESSALYLSRKAERENQELKKSIYDYEHILLNIQDSCGNPMQFHFKPVSVKEGGATFALGYHCYLRYFKKGSSLSPGVHYVKKEEIDTSGALYEIDLLSLYGLRNVSDMVLVQPSVATWAIAKDSLLGDNYVNLYVPIYLIPEYLPVAIVGFHEAGHYHKGHSEIDAWTWANKRTARIMRRKDDFVLQYCKKGLFDIYKQAGIMKMIMNYGWLSHIAYCKIDPDAFFKERGRRYPKNWLETAEDDWSFMQKMHNRAIDTFKNEATKRV